MSERSEFVGVICDGDRRWALDEFSVQDKAALTEEQLRLGYEKGAVAVRELMNTAVKESISTLALWGLSDENMKQRTEENLRALFDAFHNFFQRLLEDWIDNDGNRTVRLIHLGQPLDALPDYTQNARNSLNELVRATTKRTGQVIAFCLNYNGRTERDAAINEWAASRTGSFQDFLPLSKLPNRTCQPLDYLIRTNVPVGQPFRRGNFLIGYENNYETSYATTPLTMPEYSPEAFRADLEILREGRRKKPGS